MSQLYDVPVEATVDGIKFHYEDGEVEVDYNASNGDVVRLTIEPLEVKVTDGFRAAVKKACKCDSSSGGGSGGSTGGGVLVVRGTLSGSTMTLDHTWQEIHDAACVVYKDKEGVQYLSVCDYFINYNVTFVYFLGDGTVGRTEFFATSSDGYPERTVQSGGGGRS